MATPAFTYSPPSITVVTNGPLNVLQAAAPLKTILMLGTAPQGPDFPTLCSAQDALNLFGNPGSYTSLGYDLPLALRLASIQRQPTAGTGVQFLVCRVGVTRASQIIAASAGTGTTIAGIGQYAGSSGNNLAINVVITGGAITSVTIYDVTTVSAPVIKQQFIAGANANLSSIQQMANTINGANPLRNPNSIVQITAVGTGALTSTVVGSTNSVSIGGGMYGQQLISGTDGLGANSSDGTIAPLLAASLWAFADYIYAGFDYSAIAPTILTHIQSALLQNQFRKAVLGPKSGVTYGTLTSGTYVSGNTSDRIVCIGHDSVYTVSPITGNPTIVDGFYAAAAFAGLKAAGPTQETCTKFAIGGFTGVVTPTDLVASTNGLTQAQLNLLAGSGLLVFEQTLADGALRIRDSITTAPYAFTGGSGGVNGGINVFSQFSARDIDDAWSNAMVQALTPMLGRVFPSQSILQQAFTLACTSAAAALGNTIGGYSISVQLSPTTNQPTVVGNYTMPFPVLNITIPTAFTIA